MALIKLNNQSLSAVTSAGLPSGTVLQVQSSVQTGSEISQTGSAFTASGHTVTITPASSSNKILIMLQGGNQFQDTASDSIDVAMYYKDGTAAYTRMTSSVLDTAVYNSAGGIVAPHSFTYLHSPSSSNTLIYQPYFRANNGTTCYYQNNHYGGGYGNISLIAMEIAG